MPKVKTHTASKKRFKKNCNGKIKKSKSFKRHHAWAKSTKQKRDLRKSVFLNTTAQKKISILIPY